MQTRIWERFKIRPNGVGTLRIAAASVETSRLKCARILSVASANAARSLTNSVWALRIASESIDKSARAAPKHCESHLRASKDLARKPYERCESHLRAPKDLARKAPEGCDLHQRTLRNLAWAASECCEFHLRATINIDPATPEHCECLAEFMKRQNGIYGPKTNATYVAIARRKGASPSGVTIGRRQRHASAPHTTS